MTALVSEKMMDPTPMQAPSHNRNSSEQLPSDSPRLSPSPEAPDRTSSAPSPFKQLDHQSHSPTREEEYRQLFRLPPDEVLIQDFNCALQENFLLQGHMYLFVHHICFYSNLFGFETKKVIPFSEITAVRRAKAVAVFPTAIEIISHGKKYFFTSFLFRDEAYKLVHEGWLQHGSGSKAMDQQDPKADEVCSHENVSYIAEESDSARQSLDESDVTGSDVYQPIFEESKHLVDGEFEIIPASSVMEAREEPNALPAGPAPVIECSSSGKSSTWKPEQTDAPGVPEGYTKVADSKFPIRAEEFFNLFFSDDSVNFHEVFHTKCGDKDFKCSTWHPHEKFGNMRDVSFQHPIKIYFGARFGSCQEVQKYRIYRNSHLIIDTSQTIDDVPYGDYFTVEGRWDLEEHGNNCTLTVYTNVAFSKKTMWKGKIVQSTVEECREAYAIWIDLAHAVLKQKNLEKEGVSALNMLSNTQAQAEKLATSQQRLAAEASDARISTLPDVKDQRVTYLPQEGPSEALTGSLFRNTVSKFYTSIKHMSTPSLLLVVTIAVILVLMQMSILVLLSRPQRVHVISQGGGCMNGIENRGDALASVNRQIKYLKEEMHFAETLLEKMQNEHAQLKGKLRELELFRNQ